MAEVALAYDPVLKRPGCALLQASMGGNGGSEEFRLFDPQDWLLHPTPDLKLLKGDRALWEKVVAITIAARKQGG